MFQTLCRAENPFAQESPEEKLLRMTKGMISDTRRSELLKEAAVNMGPRFIVRAMDWPAQARDFMLGVLITDRVLTELATSRLAPEFWDAIIHLLRTAGLFGQRWVADTLRQLARISHRTAIQSGGEDLSLVRAVCSPQVPKRQHAHVFLLACFVR